MKPLRAFLSVLVFGGALLGSVRAQLVHISATNPMEGSSGLIFRANDASIPWNHTAGFISRLDLYYDVNDAVGSDGFYSFSNPDRNVWRIKVHAYGLGDFEIIRPLQSLVAGESSMTFEYAGDVFEEFDLTLMFAEPFTGPGLPVPPLQFSETSYYLAGGTTFFDVPNLNEGYGGGSFESVNVRLAQAVDFTPVPEPSTYAAGAVLLLGFALWHRRRRANTAALQAAA
jgi:hypothetical protein